MKRRLWALLCALALAASLTACRADNADQRGGLAGDVERGLEDAGDGLRDAKDDLEDDLDRMIEDGALTGDR